MDTKLAHLVDDLQLNLPGVVPTGIQPVLRNVLREFFIETNGWQQTISFNTSPNVIGYTLTFTTSADPVRLLSVADANSRPINATMPEGWLIVIPYAPAAVETWTATIVTTINGDTDGDGYPIFPEWVLGRHYDVVLNGVMARMLSQIAKPYSNVQMAGYYQKQYKAGLAGARHAVSMQNTQGGQRWRYPYFTKNSRQGLFPQGATQSAAGGVLNPLVTKGQVMAAVSALLSGGIFGFEAWVSASPDDAYNIALRYAEDAVALQPALLAYMQASATATPPGLGLSASAASLQWSTLLAAAQGYAR